MHFILLRGRLFLLVEAPLLQRRLQHFIVCRRSGGFPRACWHGSMPWCCPQHHPFTPSSNCLRIQSDSIASSAPTRILRICSISAHSRIPASIMPNGAPFGITLIAARGQDTALAAMGRVFHARSGLTMGATDVPVTQPLPVASSLQPDEIALVVVGAHLSAMPLNGELQALHSRLLECTKTTADYRLFALPHTMPPKPGLQRVADGTGHSIDVEVWALTREAFGAFVGNVPAPLAIGTVRWRVAARPRVSL